MTRKRNSKGQFIKETNVENYKMELTIPNIKYLIKYILYTTPWIYLFLVKLKIIEKVHFYSRKTIYNKEKQMVKRIYKRVNL